MALPLLPIQGQNPWYTERTAWDTAVEAQIGASSLAITQEATTRQLEDAKKRDILATVVTSGTANFNSYTDVGVFAFTATNTHVTSPTSDTGILLVEKFQTTSISQRYMAHGTAALEPEVYFRFAVSGSWSNWRRVGNVQGFIPRGKISFIGDSYMAGLGLTNPTTERWTSLMCAQLGCTEQNLALSGTGYVNGTGTTTFVARSGLVASDTGTVIISGGINDAPLAPTQAAITTAVATIVSNIRGIAPLARIVFISPMAFQNSPSVTLMDMDSKIRAAVRAQGDSIMYINDAMWLRVDRDELAQGDGHPNAAGSQVIRSWVINQLWREPYDGSVQGKFISTASGDVPLTGPTLQIVADGTVRDARPGWWRIEGQLICYNGVVGFLGIRAGSYTEEIRDDVVSANPTVKNSGFDYYHPGGDLYLAVGYRPNGATTVTITGLKKNRVTANWMRI